MRSNLLKIFGLVFATAVVGIIYSCGGQVPFCIGGEQFCPKAELGEDCSASSECISQLCAENGKCEPLCGNGTVENGELCDEGSANGDAPDATCRRDCTPQRCGDGIIDTGLGEECDDSNTVSGDGCSADCKKEAQAPECGNGVIEGLEECDNGAANSDTVPDACRTTCKLPYCGDNVTDPSLVEQCDDGNSDPNDGCNNCKVCSIVNPPPNLNPSCVVDATCCVGSCDDQRCRLHHPQYPCDIDADCLSNDCIDSGPQAGLCQCSDVGKPCFYAQDCCDQQAGCEDQGPNAWTCK